MDIYDKSQANNIFYQALYQIYLEILSSFDLLNRSKFYLI